MSTFSLYAQYYDLLYENKDYREEAAYINSILKKHIPDAKTILEFGCGTGRYSAEFATLGYEVTGIDMSSDMIANCMSHFRSLPSSLQDNLDVLQGDVRQLKTAGKPGDKISCFNLPSVQRHHPDSAPG